MQVQQTSHSISRAFALLAMLLVAAALSASGASAHAAKRATKHPVKRVSKPTLKTSTTPDSIAASATGDPFAWAEPAIADTQTSGLLPVVLTTKPGAVVSRRAFAKALALLDADRSATAGTPSLLSTIPTGAALSDVANTTIYARETALGWFAPVSGAFAGGAPITGNDASVAIIGALGLQSTQTSFAAALQANLPGIAYSYPAAAAQVMARSLGLRYNNLQGTEQQEVGPADPMHVSHAAYMLDHAANLPSWALQNEQQYASFSLPALGPNQRTVLTTAASMIGQPYIWGGTTELTQSQGHGGFDCSGLVWRSVWHSGVVAASEDALAARTSEDMSAIGARITDPAQMTPADVMFFTDTASKTKPTDNYHAALYMGNGWVIDSSGGNDGVSIEPMSGWYSSQFSWGRQVLHTN